MIKKQIAILGSTGSIGMTTLDIIKKDKKKFDLVLLTTNKNVSKIYQQAVYFKVKNVIILDNSKYLLWKNKFIKKNIKVFNNFDALDKIFKKKIYYSINAISGLHGLFPTLKIIKYSKKIAIANKESIICGWKLISRELKKNKTTFIPVDSEHFSIFKLIDGEPHQQIKKIILTASGGPFLKKKIDKKITVSDALNHPNWKMGRKITIDSATMMNKVFEVIEAKKIFNINIKNIEILINPNSYIHAIVVYNNGTIKFLAHETKMDIPIFNSIYEIHEKKYNTEAIDLNKINNLKLSIPNIKKFKSLTFLKLIPNKDSLFETILISVNDELVKMFLNKEINFNELHQFLFKIINFKIFKKYCNVKPNSIKQIFSMINLSKQIVNDYVRKKKQND